MGYRYLGRLCLTDHWRKPHPVAIYSCDPARHGLSLEGQLHEAVLIDQEHVGAAHQKGVGGHWHLSIVGCLEHLRTDSTNGMQLLPEKNMH